LATYPWQQQLFSRGLLNRSRQAGKSTCVAFLALLEALTIQEHLVLMVSRSARQSRLLLGKVRDFIVRMPLNSVQRAQISAEQIVFPNLSKIVALPCKEEAIRGYSSDGRIMYLSTPFGGVGFFFDAWTSPTQEGGCSTNLGKTLRLWYTTHWLEVSYDCGVFPHRAASFEETLL
jgi:hypothetical protein